MWAFIRESFPIWFFDATGNVHKNINGQKKPFLYTIAFHDKKKKIILPVVDFITTAHDQYNIEKFLNIFKSKINNDLTANIIVTDMSWALMNAVMNSFNKCDISTYLEWCYNVVFKNCSNQSYNSTNNKQLILYLCSTHFLKNIIKKSKKVNVNEEIRKSFIFMF